MLIQIKIIFSFMNHIINMRRGTFGNAYFQVNIQEISTEFVRYRISRPIRRAFFPPEKCDLNSTCILCAKVLYAFCWVIPRRLNFKCRRSDHSVCSNFIGR